MFDLNREINPKKKIYAKKKNTALWKPVCRKSPDTDYVSNTLNTRLSSYTQYNFMKLKLFQFMPHFFYGGVIELINWKVELPN